MTYGALARAAPDTPLRRHAIYSTRGRPFIAGASRICGRHFARATRSQSMRARAALLRAARDGQFLADCMTQPMRAISISDTSALVALAAPAIYA